MSLKSRKALARKYFRKAQRLRAKRNKMKKIKRTKSAKRVYKYLRKRLGSGPRKVK